MAKKEPVHPIAFPYSLVEKNPFGFPQWENEEHKRWAFDMEQGFALGVQEIARRMLKCQFDPGFITWTTGLSHADLEEIKPTLDLGPNARRKIKGYKINRTETDTVCEVMCEWIYETKNEEK